MNYTTFGSKFSGILYRGFNNGPWGQNALWQPNLDNIDLLARALYQTRLRVTVYNNHHSLGENRPNRLFINDTQGFPLLEELYGGVVELLAISEELALFYLFVRQQRGGANEEQNQNQLTQIRDWGKRTDEEAAQDRRRCRYIAGRVAMRLVINAAAQPLQRVRAAIKQIVHDLGSNDWRQAEHQVAITNCVAADALITHVETLAGKCEKELAEDVSAGTAEGAVKRSFDNISSLMHAKGIQLRTEDLFFVRGLPNVICQDLEQKFFRAFGWLYQSDLDVSTLKANRGTLNEDQFGLQLEKAVDNHDEQLRLIAAQRTRRSQHGAHVAAALWSQKGLKTAMEELTEAVTRLKSDIRKVPAHLHTALMTNCLAAAAIIRTARNEQLNEVDEELHNETPRYGSVLDAQRREFKELIRDRYKDEASTPPAS